MRESAWVGSPSSFTRAPSSGTRCPFSRTWTLSFWWWRGSSSNIFQLFCKKNLLILSTLLPSFSPHSWFSCIFLLPVCRPISPTASTPDFILNFLFLALQINNKKTKINYLNGKNSVFRWKEIEIVYFHLPGQLRPPSPHYAVLTNWSGGFNNKTSQRIVE